MNPTEPSSRDANDARGEGSGSPDPAALRSARIRASEFVEQRIVGYRRWRRIGIALLLAAAMLLAWRAWRGAGDDYSRFDQRSFIVDGTIDGDAFHLADPNRTTATLLGVAAPEPGTHFAGQSADYLRGRLVGKTVLIRLDGTQTRDPAGRLRAYVYLSDSNLINADIVRDGRAYADRRMRHTFAPVIEQLETEARKARRGLWEQVTDDQHPAWRRGWLAERKRDD